MIGKSTKLDGEKGRGGSVGEVVGQVDIGSWTGRKETTKTITITIITIIIITIRHQLTDNISNSGLESINRSRLDTTTNTSMETGELVEGAITDMLQELRG